MRKIALILASLWSMVEGALGATLVPNGEQQFINGSGAPYANGKVYFYSNYPTCTILKNTWKDAAGSILNTNPVILDAAGRATIFGSGGYCQVLKDANNNTVWTKYTADTSATSGLSWGGTSGGTANAQTITSSAFSFIDGQTIYFVAGATNTTAMTLSVNGGAAAALVKPTSNGVSFLTGGELVTGNLVGVSYVQATGQFQLVTNNAWGNGAATNIAAGATTNLNSVVSHVANVTGSGVTITSFGTGGSNAATEGVYYLTFAGANTITYNATSMITPTGADLPIYAGDALIVNYLGGSNWRILAKEPANPLLLTNAQTGTTYTVLSTDWNKLLTFSNASTTNVTVPQATGTFGAGFSFRVQNVGQQPVVLTPTTSTIGGATSLSINPGNGLMVVSDGTNWLLSGNPRGLTQMPIYTNSGSIASYNFTTISPDAKKIVIGFRGVGGTGTLLIRFMVAGATVSSGYAGGYSAGSNAIVTASYTSGCNIFNSINGNVYGTLTLVNLGGNIWAGSGTAHDTTGPAYQFNTCAISLAGAVTGLTLSATSITAGSVGVVYE